MQSDVDFKRGFNTHNTAYLFVRVKEKNNVLFKVNMFPSSVKLQMKLPVTNRKTTVPLDSKHASKLFFFI